MVHGGNTSEQLRFVRELSSKISDREAKDIFDQFASDYNNVLQDRPSQDERAQVAAFLTVAATLTSDWAQKKGVPIPE